MTWKGRGWKRPWPNLRCLSICLEGLRKTTKKSDTIAGLQAEIWTWHLPNNAGALTTLQRRLVICPFREPVPVLEVTGITRRRIQGITRITNKICNEFKTVGFEVLTAASVKMAVLWVVAPCGLVGVYQRFRGTCCLHRQGDELLYTVLQPRRQPSSNLKQILLHSRHLLI
jgi:hypothetical protein